MIKLIRSLTKIKQKESYISIPRFTILFKKRLKAFGSCTPTFSKKQQVSKDFVQEPIHNLVQFFA